MSPSGTIADALQHTFAAPPLEQATVLDAMRLGVISCPPDMPLREVARILATYRVHSVVISEAAEGRPAGIVSDLDLAAAAAAGDIDKRTARDLVRREPLTVSPEVPLKRAAQLMAERETSHLVVVQPHTGHPVGVLSTLDLAGVLAWGGIA